MCSPPILSGIITFSAPAVFSFLMVLLLEALLITFILGLSSLDEITINKLSASEGREAIIPDAFSMPACFRMSSSMALP